MGQAWLNVDLFSKLYDRLDGDQPDDDFWYHIVEITDVERSEAKDKAGRIKRLYSNGLPYVSAVKSANEESAEKASRPEDEVNVESQMSENVDASIKTRDFGEIKIRDRDTLELARNLLDLLEKQYNGNSE